MEDAALCLERTDNARSPLAQWPTREEHLVDNYEKTFMVAGGIGIATLLPWSVATTNVECMLSAIVIAYVRCDIYPTTTNALR